MKKRPVTLHVSDHAVLRWLERAHGVDVEAVRQHLLGKAIKGAVLRANAVKCERVRIVLLEAGRFEGVDHVVVPTVLRTVQRS